MIRQISSSGDFFVAVNPWAVSFYCTGFSWWSSSRLQL